MSLGVAPVFTDAAAAIYGNVVAAGLEIDNVHLVLNHADGTPAADTVVTIPAGADSIIVEIEIDLHGSSEILKAKIDLRDGTVVLFSGSQDVFAVVGGLPQTPPEIPVEYDGPGATVTSIDVLPADSAIVSTDSIAYVTTAKDQNGANVADFALLWSVKDPTLGTVNPSGLFKPTGVRGETYVIARTLTGIKDSAHVSIALPMTKVVLISGGGQTGAVGEGLGLPVVIEAQAADNLPVANAKLTVVVTAGGGSVSPSGQVFAGSNGRVALAFTLGTALGTNTLQVTGTDITPLSVSATGIAGAAAKLIVSTRPSATALSGVLLAQQPVVRIADALGNTVTTSTASVTASAAGYTVGGTATKAAVAGVATFTDLVVTGAAGNALLTFASSGLTSDTATVALAQNIGPPAIMLAVSPIAFVDSIQGIVAPENLTTVIVKDAQANPLPGIAVKFRRHSGSGGGMNGLTGLTDTVQVVTTGVDGIAKLSSHQLQDSIGVDSILVTAAGLPDTIKFYTVVANGAPVRLVIDGEPSDAPVLTDIPVVVTVRDRLDNVTALLPGTPPNVTLAIKGGTGVTGAVLGGVLTQAAPGFATFAVTVDKVGTGYVLTATSPGLTGAESTPFAITLGQAAQLTITQGNNLAALRFQEAALPPKVLVTDAASNPLASVVVAFHVASGGGVLSNEAADFSTLTDVSGLATTDWHLGGSDVQTMTATANGVTVTFSATLAETLVVIQQPAGALNGIPLSTQPRLQLQDKAGHPAKVALVNVTASACCSTVDGIATLTGATTGSTDANGEATFADLTLNGLAGLNPKLAFGATSVDSAFSAPLIIQAGAAATITPDEEGGYLRLLPASTHTLHVIVRDASSNPVPGQVVLFSVDGGQCTFGGNSTLSDTTNGGGTAAAAVSLVGPMQSCAIHAEPVLPPPECSCEQIVPKVYQHVYVVPSSNTFNIWTGAVSDRWNEPGNWYDDSLPTGTVDVFVPAANGGSDGSLRNPKIYSADEFGYARSVIVEAGAHVQLDQSEISVQGDTLFADGSIEGPGTVALGVAPSFVRGTLNALVEFGETGCTGSNYYNVAGALNVETAYLNCELRLEASHTVTIASGLHVRQSGRLTQTAGQITVGGDALFEGNQVLTGGLLELAGNVTHTSDCETRKYLASGTHVTRFTGTSGDTLFIDWDACNATFGTLEVATTGPTGIALRISNSIYSISVGNLRVKAGGVFRINENSTVSMFVTGGVLDIEDGGKLIRDGALFAGNCSSALVAGLNVGPIQCIIVPSIRATPTTPIKKR